jgi:hypothetical protein
MAASRAKSDIALSPCWFARIKRFPEFLALSSFSSVDADKVLAFPVVVIIIIGSCRRQDF